MEVFILVLFFLILLGIGVFIVWSIGIFSLFIMLVSILVMLVFMIVV